MDVIQASIPLFFLLIGLELLVARGTGRRLYRLNDSISDLSWRHRSMASLSR